jgi:hypothetical protein
MSGQTRASMTTGEVAAMPVWMTTGGVADLINQILDKHYVPARLGGPKGQTVPYTPKYIREEVERGALVARVHDLRGSRARIRIHCDDFLVWARTKVRAEQQAVIEALATPRDMDMCSTGN